MDTLHESNQNNFYFAGNLTHYDIISPPISNKCMGCSTISTKSFTAKYILPILTSSIQKRINNIKIILRGNESQLPTLEMVSTPTLGENEPCGI
jgi:hypothetical protein